MRKIYENPSKVSTEMKIIQKTFSEADFYQFWLDFGGPRRPQNHQKWQKKQKKGSKVMGLAECAGRWGGLWRGEKAFQDSQKQCKKLKTEIEAKT